MDRKRLTITLKDELLKKLDEYIDGARIRNRSHAIEHVLGKHFSPRVKKAIVLAGGNDQGSKEIGIALELSLAQIY